MTESASLWYVYVMARPGAVKVGFSSTPADRVAYVAREVGLPVQLVAVYSPPAPGRWSAIGAERAAQAALREWRIEGEWFGVTPVRAEEAILAAGCTAAVIPASAQKRLRPLGVRVTPECMDMLQRLAIDRRSTKTRVIEDALAVLSNPREVTQADVLKWIEENFVDDGEEDSHGRQAQG